MNKDELWKKIEETRLELLELNTEFFDLLSQYALGRKSDM
jgi:hypothetical protein